MNATSKMDATSANLATFAELTYEQIPPEVVARAKSLILDTVGCALGALQAEPLISAHAVAKSVSSAKPARVLGLGYRTSADHAAFVNGSMVRYLDFNDTYISRGVAHPSDMLAPALAAAEYAQLDGKELIRGFVIGYEVFCALIDNGAMKPNEHGQLWDQATYAAISASILASALMRLTPEQLMHALSMTIASHMTMGQLRVGQISHWKGCAVGNASRNAVFCSMLAQHGMTGPEEIFSGPCGFFAATDQVFSIPRFEPSNYDYRIMFSRVKRYPSGYHSQSAIEGALRIRSQLPSLAAIRQLRLETYPSAVVHMGGDPSRWLPETRESADHSMPYVLAMALMTGDVTVQQYQEQRFKDPEVRALMAKISITVGEESKRLAPDVPLNVLHVDLEDGSTLTERADFHSGHFNNPMTEEDQDRKFLALAEPGAGMSPYKARQLLDALRTLEAVDTLDTIMDLATV